MIVGRWFQVLFTPLTAVLFTFPSRYLFTIDLEVVFSLGRWSSLFQSRFLVSRPTRSLVYYHLQYFDYETLTLFGYTFQYIHLYHKLSLTGLFPFRSPLLWKSLLISFPLGTEMFHFPRFASLSGYYISLYSGLPHSDISVSTLLDSSTKLFAV